MSYFGLTGGVATGKSTAARFFHELGAEIIDADRIGHEQLVKTSPSFQEIVKRIGPTILDGAGEISRHALGSLVFADPEKLRQLNSIVHPRIIAEVERRAAALSAEDARRVILVDAALIFEAGIGGRFKKVIVTWCPPEQQVERLLHKGLTREEAEQRLTAQIPAEEKKRRADFVIDSSGPLENTRAQVGRIYCSLHGLISGVN
ncbi:MAG: dephospho-CoA kinase [Deltaproteobacteria bacterium]